MMRPSGNAGEGPVPGLPGPGGPLGVWTGLPALDGLATPPGTGCAPWTAWRRRPVPAARPGRPGAAARYRLHAPWRLIAIRGLRRGVGCRLRRPDTDLAARTIAVRWQITSSAGCSCP
jgi:hypothetical protein